MNEAELQRFRALLVEADKPLERTLTLEEYRSAFDDLPPPTDEQITAFVAHVSHAGSWYKYLPRNRRVPLRLYLDPLAGYTVIRMTDGGLRCVERTDEKQCFHYSELVTREYRRRFGTLAFLRPDGGSVAFPVTMAGPGMSEATGWIGISGKWPGIAFPGGFAAVPREVVVLGTALVSGLIHARTGSDDPWLPSSHPSWDRAVTVSSHRDLWSRFRDRLRELESIPFAERPRFDDAFPDRNAVSYDADPVLHELLEPLRAPQREGMANAMARVRSLVYG